MKPQKLPKKAALAAITLAVLVAYAGLTDRVDPIYPGVEIESNKPNPLLPGTYCSAAFL
ncbi:hypothetical protein Pogu_0942 [Pyrobaculum oguniense TE7]|uniref:Uncharacterized protein n=1 Tax=Pyrobaculum oguniense (strain DSM 13380 / JCM 10595 / TE7) TaxID=698757 RepID=H6Q8G2_PYROT|nr:hypothetical protein Pogu_0942 [Pyrobaculum oguniense TE7]